MTTVRPCSVPLDSMLCPYQHGAGYADCYVTELPFLVTQQTFIEAFYTSPLFKLERTLLQLLASKPATDADARQLALGATQTFSAWRVESQSDSELLLADFTGRTRSWLRASAAPGSQPGSVSVLYFGSAVVPRRGGSAAKPGMGWPFHALLGFHRLYSRLLLGAAARRAWRTASGRTPPPVL